MAILLQSFQADADVYENPAFPVTYERGICYVETSSFFEIDKGAAVITEELEVKEYGCLSSCFGKKWVTINAIEIETGRTFVAKVSKVAVRSFLIRLGDRAPIIPGENVHDRIWLAIKSQLTAFPHAALLSDEELLFGPSYQRINEIHAISREAIIWLAENAALEEKLDNDRSAKITDSAFVNAIDQTIAMVTETLGRPAF